MSTAREFWKLFLGRYRWMPRADWDALVRGDTCPLCADVEQEETRYGFLVARLETSNLHLSKNQYASGYCVLMYRDHATELHQISPEKQAAFMRDLLKAGAAIAACSTRSNELSTPGQPDPAPALAPYPTLLWRSRARPSASIGVAVSAA